MLALSAPPDDTPAPTPALTIHTEASAQRHAVEAFIATVYRERFGAEVRHFTPTLVSLHDAAGRLTAAVGYRCAVDAEYHGSLSAGSVRSLVRQGGPMDDDERTRFERNPAHRDAVRLRGWDDAGKDLDAVVPDLASYRPLLEDLARASR